MHASRSRFSHLKNNLSLSKHCSLICHTKGKEHRSAWEARVAHARCSVRALGLAFHVSWVIAVDLSCASRVHSVFLSPQITHLRPFSTPSFRRRRRKFWHGNNFFTFMRRWRYLFCRPVRWNFSSSCWPYSDGTQEQLNKEHAYMYITPPPPPPPN